MTRKMKAAMAMPATLAGMRTAVLMVGSAEGRGVGEKLGTTTMKVGVHVGWDVGQPEGITEGCAEGMDVGEMEGWPEGCRVGWPVGVV